MFYTQWQHWSCRMKLVSIYSLTKPIFTLEFLILSHEFLEVACYFLHLCGYGALGDSNFSNPIFKLHCTKEIINLIITREIFNLIYIGLKIIMLFTKSEQDVGWSNARLFFHFQVNILDISIL